MVPVVVAAEVLIAATSVAGKVVRIVAVGVRWTSASRDGVLAPADEVA